MHEHPINKELTLEDEAKGLIVSIFRNGPIEDIHAGEQCPHCAGSDKVSHITDEEMKSLNKYAINKLYSLLMLKGSKPELYKQLINLNATIYAAHWDAPELVSL